MRNALRIVLSGAAVLVALVLAVAPVAADTELGHSGEVGQHSLRDTDVDPIRARAVATRRWSRALEVIAKTS